MKKMFSAYSGKLTNLIYEDNMGGQRLLCCLEIELYIRKML